MARKRAFRAPPTLMSPIRLHCVNIGSLALYQNCSPPPSSPQSGSAGSMRFVPGRTSGQSLQHAEKRVTSAPLGVRQLTEDCWQHLGQILGDQARPEELRRTAVHPSRGGNPLEGVHPLGQQAEDHSGKHVSGPGRGKPGTRRGIDRGSSVRRGDDGVGALQQHDGARARGRGAGESSLAPSPIGPKRRANSPSCGVSATRSCAPANGSEECFGA